MCKQEVFGTRVSHKNFTFSTFETIKFDENENLQMRKKSRTTRFIKKIVNKQRNNGRKNWFITDESDE